MISEKTATNEKHADNTIPSLSSREIDILKCSCQGLGCKDTARQLGISEYTVRKYRANLRLKFKVATTAEMVTAFSNQQIRDTDGAGRQSANTPLSNREQTVAGLITKGKTSKQIGKLLDISDMTVRKHRENILRKMGIKNTSQLIAHYLNTDDPR